MGRIGVVALAVLLAACGVLQPTPARFRPPLPDAEPMPEVKVEDVIAELEAAGVDCSFDPGGDIPSSWNCRQGDQDENEWFDVGFTSGEAGPIERASAMQFNDHQPDAAAFDMDAASRFAEFLVSRIVPDEFRPRDAALLDGVQRNFPVELGGGWFLGFDRSSNSRTIHVVYSNPED